MLKAYPKPTYKRRESKRKVVAESNPLECIEQETVSAWLDLHKVFYNISISGAYLHPATFNRLKRMGYKRGLPDILIFERPPAYGNQFVGVAIELKRKKGGIVSDEQKEWLEKLQKQGWFAIVCRGADEAILILEQCGYGRARPITEEEKQAVVN